ncbi:glycosyl transferase [Parazoarcus communis]|uniref:Glycosyl transferase n=1 Tax=Parazoarcus communis TaxID=41977 RepID=A0A2U8GP53_9RHOO|nr:glycosyltransferase family A protein [Parazoarcus communis]AWI75268.1 glycosyl transferase [Parazoarcus communis]
MRISLVVATMDRPDLLRRLLDSLVIQTRLPDQVILVDQSRDDLSEAVAAEFSERLNLLVLRAPPRGAPAARNIGLRHVDGDVIGFPDDDCWYPVGAVERVHGEFSKDDHLDIFSGMSFNEKGVPSQGRWATVRQTIDRYSAWVTQTQYTTFYRKAVFEKVGNFREELGTGAGTLWGSGEETEFMIRSVDRGCHAVYDPSFYIHHPEPLSQFDAKTFSRGRSYNMGFGRVMKLAGYPIWFVGYMALRPLVGAVVSLAKGSFGRSRYQLIASYFRLRGWLYRL